MFNRSSLNLEQEQISDTLAVKTDLFGTHGSLVCRLVCCCV